MPNQPIRVGIIGCGQIAQFHLQFYSKIPEAKVIALCDVSEAHAGFGSQWGIAPKDQYGAIQDLLARKDIDAVDVCLHNNHHMPATVAALEAGKHVYCEKPMAGTYADAFTMLQASRKLGKKLHIQLSKLYDPATRAAKELIDTGELGQVFHARSSGHRRRGRPYVDGYGSINFVRKHVAAGGALYDMGVYHISQLLYLLGNPRVQRINGKTYQAIAMDPVRREASAYDVEELGLGFVRFDGGATMDIIEAWAIHLDSLEGSSIIGSKGGVRLEPFGFFHTTGDIDVNGTVDLKVAMERWDSIREAGPYASSQAHWIAALTGKVELLPTAEIALNTMLISEGIYLSEKLAREVTAEEVMAQSKSTSIGI